MNLMGLLEHDYASNVGPEELPEFRCDISIFFLFYLSFERQFWKSIHDEIAYNAVRIGTLFNRT